MSIFIHKYYEKIKKTDTATLYILASVFALLLMIYGIVELSDDVMEGDTQQLDILILQYFRQEDDLHTPLGPSWLLQAARDITALGGHTVLTLVTLIAAGYCAMIRRYRTIIFILVASAGGMLTNHWLKGFFGRARPDVVPHLVEVSTLSFPSGHAMLSAAIYLSLAAIISQILPKYKQKTYILSIAFLLTGLIGVSRIYLGVHYPSDVLAGWITGTAWAILCWLVMRVVFIKRRKKGI